MSINFNEVDSPVEIYEPLYSVQNTSQNKDIRTIPARLAVAYDNSTLEESYEYAVITPGAIKLRERIKLEEIAILGNDEICSDIIDKYMQHESYIPNCEKRAESITELNLFAYRKYIDDISGILRLFYNVEVLSLPRCMTGGSLKAVEELKNLRELNLEGWFSMTDDDLINLTNLANAKNIQKLYLLGYKNNITDRGIAALQRLSDLKCLSLKSCPGIMGAGIACLKDLPALHSLTVEACVNIRFQDLSSLSNLTHLEIFNHFQSNEDIISLRNLKNLEVLTLRGCSRISDSCMIDLIRNSPNLKVLNFKNCLNITDELVAIAKKIKPSLEINGIVCKDDSITGHSYTSQSTCSKIINAVRSNCCSYLLMKIMNIYSCRKRSKRN